MKKNCTSPFITIENLSKVFKMKGDSIDGLKSLFLDFYKGEIVGLVGESGSGKTTLARLLIGLDMPTSGKILYQDKDLTSYVERYQKIQMIFQDPYSSLNPRMTVEQILSEPLEIHSCLSKSNRKQKCEEYLQLVGLSPSDLKRFPHEFSGGQRQRIGIARALIVEPEFVICDEPVSALDVSIQAQIINLLKKLQKERNLTYLFISHDLSVVRHIATRIAVMKLGEIVEIGETESLCTSPTHPYTQELLSSFSPIS